MSRKKDVLICGYYGFSNLGDELLLASIFNLLLENGVKSEQIAALSSSVVENKNTFGFKTVNRMHIFEIISALKKSRTLLLGGGGLFQDTTSIRSCFYYWAIVRLARLFGSRPWMVGQSIGPLNSFLSKKMTKNAFSVCEYRGVRDVRSLNILKEWNLDGVLTSDYVTALNVKKRSENGTKMLLNVRPGYQQLSDEVILHASRYAKENNIDIIAVALSNEDYKLILDYIDKGSLTAVRVVLLENLNDFEELAFDAKLAVGMRFHFLLLSCLAHLSVCAASYDPKVSSLCSEWSIPEISSELRFSKAVNDDFIAKKSNMIKESFAFALKKVLEE